MKGAKPRFFFGMTSNEKAVYYQFDRKIVAVHLEKKDFNLEEKTILFTLVVNLGLSLFLYQERNPICATVL